MLISVGVFLGLVGEGWRESAEHQELAKASLRRFRAEFQANKAEVDRVHGRHVQQLQALEKYFAEHARRRSSRDANRCPSRFRT